MNLLLVLFLLFSSSFTFAEDAPVQTISYQENAVVTIKGHTFTSTQLVFGNKEKILDVEGGDRDGWVVTYQKNLPNMIFIKPTVLGSDSNITVITTRHTYYFHVLSNKELEKSIVPTYAVKFIYPVEEREELKKTLQANNKEVEANNAPKVKNAPLKEPAKQTKKLTLENKPKTEQHNKDYTFNGSRYIMPVQVYDDGVFTYFEMHPNQPLPAIFVVDDQAGDEEVTNIRRQGVFLIIHRVAPQFTLRMGKTQVASVFNRSLIARLKIQRR